MKSRGVSKLVSVKFTDSSGKFATSKAPPRNEAAEELETADA